jgi:hypothetical protein
VTRSCAFCGADVTTGEHFYRQGDGSYICEICDAGRCVMCGHPEATIDEGADEAVCADCRRAAKERPFEQNAERQAAFYAGWDAVFGKRGRTMERFYTRIGENWLVVSGGEFHHGDIQVGWYAHDPFTSVGVFLSPAEALQLAAALNEHVARLKAGEEEKSA